MADVNTTLTELQKYGIDTSWLSGWLNNLPSDQQQQALQALQGRIDSGHVTTTNDINTAAHQAVDQYRTQQDPVSQLGGTGVGIFPWESHTAWSQDQLDALRKYFSTDPVLKNDTGMQQRVVEQLKKNRGAGDPVEQAKGIAWGQMSLQQKAQYGYQPGDIKSLDDLKKKAKEDAPFDTNVNWSGLENYINQLSPADKYAALQLANQRLSSAFGGVTGSQELIDQTLAAVTQQQQQQTSQGQASSTSQTSAPGATGTAAFQALTPNQGQTTVTDQQKQLYQQATGQDFDTAYNNFANNYAIAVQQQDAYGRATGSEQLWSSGGYTPLAQGYSFGAAQPRTSDQQKPTEAQFLGMQSQTTLKLANAIMTAADTTALSTYGTHLDSSLQSQIMAKISTLPLDAQAALANNPQGAEASGGALDIGAILSGYASQNPQWAKTVSAASDTTAYNLTQASAPSPIKGMQSGAYDKLVSTMRPLWEQSFRREPTQAELEHFAGWDPNEIQGWVNSQRSLDNPSMTNGERTSYITAADKASQAFFGTPADSRMIDVLHGHFNPDAEPPTVSPVAVSSSATKPPITPAKTP